MWNSASRKQYEGFRRAVRLSKCTDASPDVARGHHPTYATVLSKANLTSAASIAALPLSEFLSRVQDCIPVKDATTIYDRATNTHETRTLTSFESVRGSGLAAIEGNISTRERLAMVKATGETLADFGLERLFGNLDRDDCNDCGSFTSPGAYFVELLQFLRSNGLRDNEWYEGKVYGTALECLLARRPDLGKLELTCANTKTAVPYQDLANEAMESFVVYLWENAHPNRKIKEGTIQVYKNPSPICGDILPEQEVFNTDAYAILSEAMCTPTTLPYHQPLDEIRTFLNHLQTTRHELLSTFRRAFHSNTIVAKDAEAASTKEIHDIAQSRAITAEYLGLTEPEYISLTGQDFLQNTYDPLTSDAAAISEEAAKPTRLGAWWEYWGYKKKAHALHVDTSPELIRAEFLRRTGLQSSDLVELLNTRYVNPYVSRAKNISILECNEFGLESLSQLLKKAVSPEGVVPTEPEKRYKFVIDYLHAQQIQSTTISSTGSFSRDQIEKWVKEHFETFSKVIVFENPHMSEGWHSGHARLCHLDGTRLNPSELMRINQFVRLRAKLGWSFGELDMAIAGVAGATDPRVITATFLDELVAICRIREMAGVELPHLLTLWHGMISKEDNGIYAQLFLHHQQIITDPLFKPNEQGNYWCEPGKFSGDLSFIKASFGLTEDDLQALLHHQIAGGTTLADEGITLPNLDFLYSFCLTAQILHTSPKTLSQAISIYGNFFKRPTRTLRFFQDWRDMSNAGISFKQLHYIINGADDPLDPLTPSKHTILAVAKSLLNGIDVINTTHPLIRPEEHDAITKAALTAKVSLLYTATQVEQLHLFLESPPAWHEKQLPQWLKLNFCFIDDTTREILFAADNSVGKKRFHFLQSFVPYLRRQLIERLIVTVMSEAVRLPTVLTKHLLAAHIQTKVGDIEGTAMGAIADIRINNASDESSSFEGHIIPSCDEEYTFVSSHAQDTAMQLDHCHLPFTNSEHLSVGPYDLKGGRAYPFGSTKEADHHLLWKMPSSPLHAIPEVVRVPTYAFDTIGPILIQLGKIAMLVNNCNLCEDEVVHLSSRPAEAPLLHHGILTFQGWKDLLGYLTLRNSLPTKPGKSLIDLFKWASNPGDFEAAPAGSKTLAERLSDLLQVKEKVVERTMAHLGILERSSYIDWTNLNPLKQACYAAQQLKLDVDSLFSWCEPLGEFENARSISQSLQRSIRARYTQHDWSIAVEPLLHRLRRNRQAALKGYLLTQPEIVKWGITDATSLFEFFLLDNLGACPATSRIKMAVATVQLFIQRVLCGQEEKYGVPMRTLDRTRWEWLRCYATWEKERRVWVYPENWVEPELRDNKSAAFKEFETDILNSDLDPRSVNNAVKRYVARVDEVANLHVVSLCEDTDRKVIHIFARSRGAPYVYYCRSYHPVEGTWHPWEKMHVDIPHYNDDDIDSANHGGAFLKAVVWMGRLIVFIPHFVKTIGLNPQADNHQNRHSTSGSNRSIEHWDLKIGWTEYQNGKWTPAQVTAKAFRTESGPGGAGTLRECVFNITSCNDDLYLSAQVEAQRTAWFRLSRGQFDAVEATDLLTHEYEAATPRVNASKPGIHREFGTIVDKDVIFVSAVDPSISNTHPCPNTMHPCPHTSNPCIHTTTTSLTTISYDRRNPTSAVFSTSPDYKTPFYHEFSSQLLRHTASSSTLSELYSAFGSNVTLHKPTALGSASVPACLETLIAPNYHELKSPYALYNWELGLHIPMLLMEALHSTHQYEHALAIAHHVFDPMSHHSLEHGNDYCTKDDGGHHEISYPKRSSVWKWVPFREHSAQNVLGRLLQSLAAHPPDAAGGSVKGSRDAPWHPHVVARSRPVAYMKSFVASYINILLAAGDQYFRQNTAESVSRAVQYYTLAAHIYGQPPPAARKRGRKNPETYGSLVKKLGMIKTEGRETTAAFTSADSLIRTTGTTGPGQAYDGDVGLYFSVPENQKLRDLRGKIDDRLYKIQQCQSILGSTCKVELLITPSVNNAVLMRGAAKDLGLYSIFQGTNVPMPNYRFRYILQKAFEMVKELRSLSGAFLGAMKNKDEETYRLVKAGHETSINSMVLGMKKLAIEEANKILASLQESRKVLVSELQHLYNLLGEAKNPPLEGEDFQELIGPVVTAEKASGFRINLFERAEISNANAATEFMVKRNPGAVSPGVFLGHPAMSTTAMPVLETGIRTGLGPLQMANVASKSPFSRVMTAEMELLKSHSLGAARKSALVRQYQDRVQQANTTGHEIQAIDKEIEAQKIRIQITSLEIELQQQRLEQAVETEQFHRAKYTSRDLCVWREKQLRNLHYQAYLLAYDFARQAEHTFHFERGPANSFQFERGAAITNFIQGTWDANKDGLFSGEELLLGLKRLEMAYNDTRGHDFEITKNISLRQLNPRALLELNHIGNCEFDVPEVLFDIDYPGHYKRRIKYVSLTLNTGKLSTTTSVNCTMRLVRHSYRTKPAPTREDYINAYLKRTSGSFHTDIVPIDAIATSNARDDTGLFKDSSLLKLTPGDERYAPFEGAGVISRWKLELPAHYRSFDYRTITDATLHLRYTSVYGGDTLKAVATDYADWYLSSIREFRGGAGSWAMYDVRAECAADFKVFQTNHLINMTTLSDALPFFARYSIKAIVKEIFIFTSSNIDASRWKMVVPVGAATKETKDLGFTVCPSRVLRCYSTGADVDSAFGSWGLHLAKADKGEYPRDLWVVVHYTLVRPVRKT